MTTVVPGAESNLPVYPGATKMNRPTTAMNMCGHKMTSTVYSLRGTTEDTVADWYAGKMSGSTELHDPSIHSATMHPVAVIGGDGAQAASVVNVPSIGTMISLSTYDPALSSDEVQMYKNLVSGNPAVKAQAIAAGKAKCGSNFFFGK